VLEAKDLKWQYGCVEGFERARLLKQPVILKLAPTRTLTVFVRDKDGRPLKGAKVYLGHRWGTIQFSYTGMTDESGAAVYKYLIPGGIYGAPSAYLDGYYQQASNDLLTAGSPKWRDTLTITMEDARRTQKGRVLDADGKPAPGIEIRALGKTVVTDANGEFTLENLPDSKVSVFTNSPDYPYSYTASKDTPELVIKPKKP